MKNETPTPEAREAEKAIRREKAFSRLFALLLILTLVLTMGYCTFKQFKIERDDAYASLHNSMYSLRSLISFEGSAPIMDLSLSWVVSNSLRIFSGDSFER